MATLNDEPAGDALGTQMVPRNFTQEVLAEIGRLVVQSAQGRPELAKAIFDAALPAFRDQYPHHKILAELRQGLEEAKPVAGVPIPPDLLK